MVRFERLSLTVMGDGGDRREYVIDVSDNYDPRVQVFLTWYKDEQAKALAGEVPISFG